MKCFALLVCFSFSVLTVHAKEGKTWALLAASANNWGNYGMQADVYHAYQAFRQGGIPEEQIIVMAYDDIANNRRNPYKGQVFQSYDLKDVYEGVMIDYKGDNVNKHTFLSVMQGDKEAVKRLTGREGKVIDSGPDDNVFVFISDHGGPGVVCWLDGDNMSAKEFNKTIANMHQNNKYKNMAIYIDTCFSGSMFENVLPDNIGVYGVSAANATTSAFSTDCSSLAFEKAPTCLGGLFSINWVYELSSDEREGSTLDMQFQEAKTACYGMSTPMQYGDLSVAQKKEIEFFGNSANYKKPVPGKRSRRSVDEPHAVPKQMLPYFGLTQQLRSLPKDSVEFHALAEDVSRMEALMGHADQFLEDVSKAVFGRFHSDSSVAWAELNFGPINWSCYEPVLQVVSARCSGMMRTEEVRYYAVAKFGVLVNLCNEVHTNTVISAVEAAAKHNTLCNL